MSQIMNEGSVAQLMSIVQKHLDFFTRVAQAVVEAKNNQKTSTVFCWDPELRKIAHAYAKKHGVKSAGQRACYWPSQDSTRCRECGYFGLLTEFNFEYDFSATGGCLGIWGCCPECRVGCFLPDGESMCVPVIARPNVIAIGPEAEETDPTSRRRNRRKLNQKLAENDSVLQNQLQEIEALLNPST